MYIRRVEVEKYGPTSGCSGCQKVVSGAVMSCIVAIHNDECRERTEKLMMQDLEGADRVVRTKTRMNDALARHIEEQRRLRNTTITKQVLTIIVIKWCGQITRGATRRQSGRCEN